MSDSEYYFNYFRQKYNDSCYQINNCQNQIYNLRNQRPQVVNRINQLNTDIRNVQFAINGLHNAILREGSVNSKLTAVVNKTEQAAGDFREMVVLDGANGKDISDVFSQETTQTKNTINNVWVTLKRKKKSLDLRLSYLQDDLRQRINKLQEIDRNVAQLNYNLSGLTAQKNNNYYCMEYYRRRKNQEIYSYY